MQERSFQNTHTSKVYNFIVQYLQFLLIEVEDYRKINRSEVDETKLRLDVSSFNACENQIKTETRLKTEQV